MVNKAENERDEGKIGEGRKMEAEKCIRRQGNAYLTAENAKSAETRNFLRKPVSVIRVDGIGRLPNLIAQCLEVFHGFSFIVFSAFFAVIPHDFRQNIIIVGSLAAGYYFFADKPKIQVRTKDVDCLLSPRIRAIPAGQAIADRLFAEKWRAACRG